MQPRCRRFDTPNFPSYINKVRRSRRSPATLQARYPGQTRILYSQMRSLTLDMNKNHRTVAFATNCPRLSPVCISLTQIVKVISWLLLTFEAIERSNAFSSCASCFMIAQPILVHPFTIQLRTLLKNFAPVWSLKPVCV